MNIFATSDLHLDINFSIGLVDKIVPEGTDLVIIAGDVMNGLKPEYIDMLLRLTRNTPTLFVLGNHEFYSLAFSEVPSKFQKALANSNIMLLQDESCVIEGVRFFGTTLWTDFNLFGDVTSAKRTAANSLNDYRKIRKTVSVADNEQSVSLLTPDDTMRQHHFSKLKLLDVLNTSAEPLVLITHHGCCRESAPLGECSHTLPAYTSDLYPEFEFARKRPIAMINGHFHHYNARRLDRGVLLYSNPRGYHQALPKQEWLVINGEQVNIAD